MFYTLLSWALVFAGLGYCVFRLFGIFNEAIAIHPMDALTNAQKKTANTAVGALSLQLIFTLLGLLGLAFFKIAIFTVWWGWAAFLIWGAAYVAVNILSKDLISSQLNAQESQGRVTIIRP
jgi:hypothetical protein